MKRLLFAITILIFTACAPSRHVVPLGRKEKAISYSIGGPALRRNNLPLPIPLSSISYGYGITKKTTRLAAVHISPLLFGIYHLEAGFLREFYYNKKLKIGFTGNLMGNFITDQWDWNFKFYPQIDLNFYWHFKGDSHYHCDCPKDRGSLQFIYIGSTTWFELNRRDTYNINKGQRFLLNPHFGYNIGSKRIKLNFEIKYYLPYVQLQSSNLPYYNSLGNYGAFGATIGVYKIF